MPDPALVSVERLTRRERLAILAGWTALGLLESSKAWLQGGFVVAGPHWTTALANNMPWWLAWAAFTPLVIALARRFRPDQGRLAFAAVHGLTALALSLLHHAVVGWLFFLTQGRGGRIFLQGEMVDMSLAIQVRVFFSAFFVLNVLTYFALLAAYYGLEFYKRYRFGELRAARLEVQNQRARLAALRMELNPHFLFNTLHAVGGLIRRREHSAAVAMLARLSELLRDTLEQGSDPEVPLQKELELLETYLEIEHIRFGDRLAFHVTADDRVAGVALVPPLILQPLVENAIRHGIARHPGPGEVQVRAEPDAEDLVLVVCNTGAPARLPSETGPGERTGIGLSNTRQRLAELYGDRASLTLEALPEGGVSAVIRMPLRREAASPAAALQPALDGRA